MTSHLSSGTVSVVIAVCIGWFPQAFAGPEGFTYPFSFFNISTEKKDIGFVQVFACSTNSNASTIHFKTGSEEYEQYYLVIEQNNPFNFTAGYAALTNTGEFTRELIKVRPFGLIVSSNEPTSVYAVKADSGSTDGYLVPSLTKQSTEFVVASWMVTNALFVSGLMAVGVFPDTCIDVYRVKNNGTEYVLIRTFYLLEAYQFAEVFFNIDIDPSALYLNASKPIAVVVGASCGQVPQTASYCDHMSDMIPPISELGLLHVVPSIVGRLSASGYLARVIASEQMTEVSVTYVDNTKTSGDISRGEWYDIDTDDASSPILVECDKPCLVMLYNKGFTVVASETSPTDPFMMLITPVSRYAAGACFGTASFALSTDMIEDFDNFLSISTQQQHIADVLVDGNNVPLVFWTNIGSYSVAALPVTPGFHTVSTVVGSGAKIAAWSYGHSRFIDSTSAYGYATVYEMLGDPVGSLWTDAAAKRETITKASLPETCRQQKITNGSAVAGHRASDGSSLVLYYAFQLDAKLLNPVTINATCRIVYLRGLRDFMKLAMSYINYQLCTKSMCPYVDGFGGVEVFSGNFTAGILPHHLFVSIDTTLMERNIQLDISNNLLTAIHLKIQYVGVMNTNIDAFHNCRLEIRDFLVPFINWWTLYNNGFVPATAATLSSSTSQASLSQLQRQLVANNQLLDISPPCSALVFTGSSFTSPRSQCTA